MTIDKEFVTTLIACIGFNIFSTIRLRKKTSELIAVRTKLEEQIEAIVRNQP